MYMQNNYEDVLLAKTLVFTYCIAEFQRENLSEGNTMNDDECKPVFSHSEYLLVFNESITTSYSYELYVLKSWWAFNPQSVSPIVLTIDETLDVCRERLYCVYSYVFMLIDITFILYESQRALTFSDMSLCENHQ